MSRRALAASPRPRCSAPARRCRRRADRRRAPTCRRPRPAGDWVAAERQARRPGHPADPGERRRARSRATPISAATASSTGIRRGARCWSPIARPARNTTQIYPPRRAAGRARAADRFRRPGAQRELRAAAPATTIVFERSTGGDEAAQIYRLDLATAAGDRRLRARHAARACEGWLHRSSRLLYSSVPLDRTAPAAAAPRSRRR